MTIVQKCSNDSVINNLFGKCPSQIEIDNYVSQYFGIYLYFTDTQVDPTNYQMPIQKYLQTISTGIGTNQTYVESYIHYSPLKVRTNEGSLFTKSRELNSFYFDFNRKGSANNNPKYFTITKYYHLMQNNIQIYERKYSNIFDLLSEIGGVVQFLFNLFFWVNFIYNRYVIAYDTNSLFFAIKDNQVKEKAIKKDFNFLNKNNNFKNNFNNCNDNDNNVFFDKSKLKQIKKYSSLQDIDEGKKAKIILNNNSQDNKSSLKEKNKNIMKRKSENIRMINNSKSFYYLSSINFINKINKNSFRKRNDKCIDIDSSGLNLKNNNNFKFKKEDFINNNNKINKEKDNKVLKTFTYSINEKDYFNKIYLSKNSIAKIDHKTLKYKKINNKENFKSVKELSFFIFVKYLCFEKKGSTSFLIKFRKHLLSEEHLFKSHIKTILMEKEFNSKTDQSINIFECFNEL